ncbi:hypothetical protein [Methanobrevibacter filiformis]|uniref:Integrase core domain protein n=1 Tax=Methanobrevibacter filiformis TaxID=55758 RepID=A0A165ZQW2_9EURY|nr:hypothetical protein [Methanobrevibacter filiformis]KZX11048.1 integrase core domain protein [Methanobrevibacter filiformis]
MTITKYTSPVSNIFSKIFKHNHDYDSSNMAPFKIMDNVLYLDICLPISIYLDLKKYYNPDLICIYVDNENTHCSECKSKPQYSWNGKVKIKINKLSGVYAKQYICPDCGATHVAKSEHVAKYHCYEVNITHSFALMEGIEHNSLRAIGELMKLLENTHPSHQTVKNHIREYAKKLKEEMNNLQFSGDYGYDEQHVHINGKKYYILAIIDVTSKLLIAFDVVDKLSKLNIENFIDQATMNQPRNSLTTDNKKVYRGICERLGFQHNLCLFHYLKNLNETVDKLVKNKELKYKDACLINDHGTEIQDMLQSKNYERAKKRLKQILNEIDKFHPQLQKFLNNLEPVFYEVMGHLQNEKLASTNNAMENFFGANIPKRMKRLYKSVEGLKDYLTIKTYIWNKKIIDKTNKAGKILMNILNYNKICSKIIK